MVHKKQLGLGGDEGSEPRNKRRNILWTLFKVVNNDQAREELAHSFEPLIRTCVREAIKSSFDQQLRYPQNRIESSGSRTLQLQFHNSPPQTLFTASRVVSDNQTPIKIVLYDSTTQSIVTYGPLSSVKLKVVVLDADFGRDDSEDWTKEHFEAKLVQNRMGKRPLVTGDLVVTLQHGVGYVGEISFTDNSSWIRSGKFRLGAKVNSVIDNINIKEGISNPFKVMDQRGESYQKRYPPFLNDEVWRLKRIAKDGAYHNKLNRHNIYSVQDFLRLYFTNKSALRSMLPNISNNTWETIIGHATTCCLDDQKYVYKTAQGTSLFFSSVFNLVGVNFDGQCYHAVDNLTIHQKGLVENLKQHAYRNTEDWVLVRDDPIIGYQMLLPIPATNNFNGPKSSFQQNNSQEKDLVEMPMKSDYMSISQDSSSFVVGESSHHIQGFNPTFRDSFGLYVGGHAWASGSNYVGSQLSTDDIPVDDNFQVESSIWLGNGLSLGSSNHENGVISSNSQNEMVQGSGSDVYTGEA